MNSEFIYKGLSSYVYRLDSKDERHEILGEGEIKKFGGRKYQVLKTEDNTTNGMQAMAVAPVKNGKVDTSEVVIALAVANLYSLLST